MNPKNTRILTGCVYALFTAPLYYVLHFWILSQLEPPVWIWVVFWIYAPVGFMMALAKVVIDVAAEAEEKQ